MMRYTLNQIALMTRLSTRTLRNHLKRGLLKGEKLDGSWRFSEEELGRYLSLASVKQLIASKQHAVIYDFLGEPFKPSNRICTIMDLQVSSGQAASIAAFFCELVTEHGCGVEFRFISERHYARFILAGPEDQVSGFMKAYYSSGISSAEKA